LGYCPAPHPKPTFSLELGFWDACTELSHPRQNHELERRRGTAETRLAAPCSLLARHCTPYPATNDSFAQALGLVAFRDAREVATMPAMQAPRSGSLCRLLCCTRWRRCCSRQPLIVDTSPSPLAPAFETLVLLPGAGSDPQKRRAELGEVPPERVPLNRIAGAHSTVDFPAGACENPLIQMRGGHLFQAFRQSLSAYAAFRHHPGSYKASWAAVEARVERRKASCR